MNKTELVGEIADATQQSKTRIEETINQLISIVKKKVGAGEDVTLVGFGTFTQTRRKARAGRNPQTGEAIQIPEMTVPRFRPGKDFKALLT